MNTEPYPPPLLAKKDPIQNIALFGCGPHAKRIYVGYFVRHNIQPKLIVDIESSRKVIEAMAAKHGWHDTRLFFVNATHPYIAFSDQEHHELNTLLEELMIGGGIVSTPPEIHIPYARLCLERGIKVLIDKPLSAPKDLSVGNAQQIVDDLGDLLRHDTGDNIVVQCQRRRHLGYQYVKSLIDGVSEEYGIQPHFIDIYHSDGRWDFPDEIPRLDNHPYANGYGKLLHSGYHFVDLLCFLTERYQYDDYRVHSYANTIHSFKAQVPDRFYKRMFDIDNEYVFPEKGFGEIDSYSLLQLRRDGRAMTTVAINLLHTGFSRRAWGEAKEDLYKGNGRLRHERVNIQIGPLMNIQVHSYQSTEVHDVSQPNLTECGGLEHFDIHIYRNSDLMGGKPFEIITLEQLEQDDGAMNDIGQNEYARHQLVTDFLHNVPSQSGIRSHIRTNTILAAIAKSMHEEAEVTGVLRND
ncbi:MAG TPA: hypothetical protein PKD19_00100 [Candidatus Saccharibacteria bacterium]|nr:hypothetical protein [Candidatus Saccharibacteria bacterium]